MNTANYVLDRPRTVPRVQMVITISQTQQTALVLDVRRIAPVVTRARPVQNVKMGSLVKHANIYVHSSALNAIKKTEDVQSAIQGILELTVGRAHLESMVNTVILHAMSFVTVIFVILKMGLV